jgi:hypothetical protein
MSVSIMTIPCYCAMRAYELIDMVLEDVTELSVFCERGGVALAD